MEASRVSKKKAELVITKTGERLIREVARQGVNAVYVRLGPARSEYGFFIKNGKPIPSNPHKHLKLTVIFHE